MPAGTDPYHHISHMSAYPHGQAPIAAGGAAEHGCVQSLIVQYMYMRCYYLRMSLSKSMSLSRHTHVCPCTNQAPFTAVGVAEHGRVQGLHRQHHPVCLHLLQLHPGLSHRVYLLMSFRKSTPPRNRQLIVITS